VDEGDVVVVVLSLSKIKNDISSIMTRHEKFDDDGGHLR
jgi:hypothetical protein